jgi:hypothetical protein
MKAKEVWVIVPFSRPQFFDNLVLNFKRQNFPNKKLILVENGDAIGTCKERGFEPDVLLTSGSHQATAKNEGLGYIRKHGYGFWATFDDDDYYGPNYLSEMIGYSDKAEIIGKGDFFVRMAGGTLRSFEGIGTLEYTNFIHGPTICSWAELCMDFPNTGQIGEDCSLVQRMIEEGARVWASSKYNFIFHRYPDENHHTWKISDSKLTDSLSLGIGFDPVVKDYGKNIPYDFVNDIGEEPEYETIEAGHNDIEILAEMDKSGMTEEFTRKALYEMGMIAKGENPKDKLNKTEFKLLIMNTFRRGQQAHLLDGKDAHLIEEGSLDSGGEP